MKHTKQEMLIKALKILKDLNPQYFKDENLKKIIYHENDELSRPKGKIANTWVAIVDDPIFDASEFLTISDDTGEPLYYQNANMIIHEIQKDNNVNYF
ncbi:hypothetical protein [uncultured Chryseobacterium sp.]|uniref:hypothetical protein n=2 Tax=uncultured Chryseobacterium sp. TaxID=259322 RepID=UPI0025E9181F|nr:hypothetical protein [uncultured Chryseobacterium sp.]